MLRTKTLAFLVLLLVALLTSAQFGPVGGRPRPAAGGDDCSTWGSLEFWFRGSDLGSVSSAISLWEDQSSSGNDLTQGVGASQPVVAVLGSGKGAHFDGDDDFLTFDTAFVGLNSPYTLAFVMLTDVIDDSGPLFGDSGSADRILYTETDESFHARFPAVKDITDVDAYAADTMYIIVLGRKANDDYFFYMDGVDTLLSSPSDGGGGDMDQMARRDTGSEEFDGIIGSPCLWLADHEASEQDIHDMLDEEH